MFVASFLLVGCSSSETTAPVGEVKTSKAGAESMKKAAGKAGKPPMPPLD
jgi:uncharacterized protein YcfL